MRQNRDSRYKPIHITSMDFFFFYKVAKVILWEKHNLFNKRYWNNWTSIRKK